MHTGGGGGAEGIDFGDSGLRLCALWAPLLTVNSGFPEKPKPLTTLIPKLLNPRLKTLNPQCQVGSKGVCRGKMRESNPVLI